MHILCSCVCHCHFTQSKSRRGMHLDEEDYDVAVEHIFPLIIVEIIVTAIATCAPCKSNGNSRRG